MKKVRLTYLLPLQTTKAVTPNEADGFSDGRMVPVPAGPGGVFQDVQSANDKGMRAVPAGGVHVQTAPEGGGAHPPPAWQHPAHPHQERRLGKDASGTSGSFLFYL